MTKEQILKSMQDYVIELKVMSDKGSILKEALSKMSVEEVKWYDVEFCKWLNSQKFNLPKQ